MENPAEWCRCEKVVSDALDEWGEGAGRAGLSKPALVATRLRQHGIVSDAAEPPLGRDALREPLPRPQAPASGGAEKQCDCLAGNCTCEEPPFNENHYRYHTPAGPNPECVNCTYMNWYQP